MDGCLSISIHSFPNLTTRKTSTAVGWPNSQGDTLWPAPQGRAVGEAPFVGEQ